MSGTIFRALLLFLLAPLACSDEPQDRSFPSDKNDAPWDRLGLFIAINEYADPGIMDLDGCVNDMVALRQVLTDQYGFKRTSLITDERATRDGIHKAMQTLIDQTKIAAKKLAEAGSDKTPYVVLAYAGHGREIVDVPPRKDEKDGKDSTWSPHDTDRSAAREIRDDDINAVLNALEAAGARVIFISDSCHSGTVFRGAEFLKVRSIRPRVGEAMPAPADEPLFPAGNFKGNLGSVKYTACADVQQAGEAMGDDGKPHGRFSEVLTSSLRHGRRGLTYDELHRDLLTRFKVLYPRVISQAPQFQASSQLSGLHLFGDSYAPPHGTIDVKSQEDGKVRVMLGELHGAAKGATVEIYKNLDDLERRRGQLTTATVVSNDAGSSIVALDRTEILPATAVARLRRIHMSSYVVHVATPLPADLQEETAKLFDSGQLKQPKPGGPYTVAIYHRPERNEVHFHDPSELPDADGGEPFLVVEAKPEFLGPNLLHLARRHQVMSLTRNPELIDVKVELAGAGKELKRNDPAIPHYPHNADVVVTFTNRSAQPLYLTLLWLEDHREFEVCTPENAENRMIPAEDTIVVKDWSVTTNAKEGSKRAWSRFSVKVLATAEPYAPSYFNHLEQEPETGRTWDKTGKTRGESQADDEDELQILLGQATHGVTRGFTKKTVKKTQWATRTLRFDVGHPAAED